MNKKLLTAVLVALAAFAGFGYQVSVGTYVSNAGKTVTVSVMLDSAAGLSCASAKLTYDPQVLVVTKAESGTLRSVTRNEPAASRTKPFF